MDSTISRRVALLMLASGALPALAAAPFEAKSVPDALKALGLAAPQESKDVSLGAPDIAENGAMVRVTLASTRSDVKQMLLLVEKNPAALAALFELSPEVVPEFHTNIKMGESSHVYAVAVTTGGQVLFARKDVKITLGGCA